MSKKTKAKLRVCSLGRTFTAAEVPRVPFNSHRSLHDFDVAIFELRGLKDEWDQAESHAMRNNRYSQIEEFLGLSRTVIVLLSDFDSLSDLFPLESVQTNPLVGQSIVFNGPDEFKEFWNSIKNLMNYGCYLDSAIGRPFLFIEETKKVVGTWVQATGGNLILLPSFRKQPNGYSSNYNDDERFFIQAILNLTEQLSLRSLDFSPPDWAINYEWGSVKTLSQNLQAIQNQVEALSRQLNSVRDNLLREERLKALFTAKGEILVEEVINVFQALGAKAEMGEPGRDDVIIEFKGKHAVIEVKGKKSSAAESDAAQLEKWVAGFKEEKGTDPKGILLIDAHCETPLAERIEPAFPHQMLKYSTQREHCLITTIQLLGLLLEARAHPEKRVDLVNSLFSTVGVYQEFSDWRKFLTAPAPAPVKAK